MNERLYNLFEKNEPYPLLYVYECEIYCNNIATGIYMGDLDELKGNKIFLGFGMSLHILDIKKRVSSEEKNYKEYKFYIDREEQNYINLTGYSTILVKLFYKKYLDEKNRENNEYMHIYSLLEKGESDKVRGVLSIEEIENEALELLVRSDSENVLNEAKKLISKAELLYFILILDDKNSNRKSDLEKLFSSTIDIAYITKDYRYIINYILNLYRYKEFYKCRENALRLLEECPQSSIVNVQSLYIAYYYLALCCEQLDEAFEAEAYFKESLRLCEIALKDNYQKHIINTAKIGESLAKHYVNKRSYDKAEEYYNKIINALLKLSCENQVRFSPTLAQYYSEYGDCLYLDEAYKFYVCEQCYKNALDIYKSLSKSDNKYLENVAISYYKLGCLFSKKDHRAGIRYLTRGIKIMKSLAKDNPYKYCDTLSLFYIEAGKLYTSIDVRKKKQMCINKAEYLKSKYS